ncbi:MAG: hypothetical protein K9G76_07850 [Bacteroidales bacterium]|nr:hypothetical protein [Bacteroidales bacterium]MCF8404764.1 hypothetical protein [Bacteroidales bacterium]
MKQNQIYKEKAEKKLNDWKSLASLINELLLFEAEQIKNEFENQKKNLSTWLESVNANIHNVKDLSEIKVQKIKSSIEMLRVQAALGKAETEDALKEQQETISNGIQQLKMNIAEAYDSSKGKIGILTDDTVDKLEDFYTRFDLFRLQLHLGKEEAKVEWEKKKKEISSVLHLIDDKISKKYEDRTENWDKFSDEMTEAWQRIKQAFTV